MKLLNVSGLRANYDGWKPSEKKEVIIGDGSPCGISSVTYPKNPILPIVQDHHKSHVD